MMSLDRLDIRAMNPKVEVRTRNAPHLWGLLRRTADIEQCSTQADAYARPGYLHLRPNGGPGGSLTDRAPATSSSGSSRSFAYAQRCDQRVRAGARVEDPSVSGVFLGALSILGSEAKY